MNNFKNFKLQLGQQKDDSVKYIALIGGLAVGAAIGALFATEKGREIKSKLSKFGEHLFTKTKEKAKKAPGKLSGIIEDVRDHARKTADDLLGPESKRHNPSAIHTDGQPSNAWKEHKEKTVYPKHKPSLN
jgi:gas vesicle protein